MKLACQLKQNKILKYAQPDERNIQFNFIVKGLRLSGEQHYMLRIIKPYQ
jgi:hypothetical protein